MQFINTLEAFGKKVVKESRQNLTKKGKNSSKKLYNSLQHNIDNRNGVSVISFSMETYGDFVDKGVRGAGGVRKSTSQFNKRNNKGKLWKIKGKNAPYKFGKSGGISPKHFKQWAQKKGLSEYAVAKVVYHQGIETTNFFTRPLEQNFDKLSDELLNSFANDIVL